MELKDRVLEIFSFVFNTDVNKLNITDTKEDIESWDSIGHLQLIMNIESEFGIKLNTEDVVSIDNVEKCIEVISKSLKK